MKRWVRNTAVGVAAAGLLTLAAYKGADTYLQRAIEARVNNYKANLDSHVNPSAVIYTIRSQDFSDRAKYLWRLRSMESEFDAYLDKFTEYLKSHPEKVRELTQPRREYSGTIKRTKDDFEIKTGEGMKTTDLTLSYIDELLNNNFVHKDDFLLFMSLYDTIFNLGLSEKLPNTVKALEYDAQYERLPESRKRQLQKEKADTVKMLKGTAASARSALEGIRDYIVSAQTLGGVGYDEIMGSERFFSDWHNHPLDISDSPKEYAPSKTDAAGSFTTGPKVVFVRVGGVAHVFGINRGRVIEIYTERIE